MADTRKPPKLATALLKRLGPKDDGLIGDLREAYAAGKSRTWYGGQVLTVIAMNAGTLDLIAPSGSLSRCLWRLF